jgi:hypothetical protein
VWRNIVQRLENIRNGVREYFPYARNKVLVELPFFKIVLNQRTNTFWPYEVTVVVPQAEYRGGCSKVGKACRTCRNADCNLEVFLNTITVVSAPRFGPESVGGGPVTGGGGVPGGGQAPGRRFPPGRRPAPAPGGPPPEGGPAPGGPAPGEPVPGGPAPGGDRPQKGKR